MNFILQRLRRGLLHTLPPFIFFFTIFYLLNVTWGLMLKEEGISKFSFSTVLVASIIVAKVFIIIDNLPFTNTFSSKPLIYQTLWKAFLYGTGTFIIRFLDYLIPFLWSSKSFTAGFGYFIAEVNWTRFWTIQLWFYLLLFVFVFSREVVVAIGPIKFRKMFLGR